MINGEYKMVIAPSDYPGKKYRNKYCYEHILIFWQYYHILPKSNEVIHHKDHNKFNNDISNLELKTRKQHVSEHGKEKTTKYVELICPWCRNIFIRERRQTHLVKHKNNYTCCSRQCAGHFMHLSVEEQQNRLQNVIIKEFDV